MDNTSYYASLILIVSQLINIDLLLSLLLMMMRLILLLFQGRYKKSFYYTLRMFKVSFNSLKKKFRGCFRRGCHKCFKEISRKTQKNIWVLQNNLLFLENGDNPGTQNVKAHEFWTYPWSFFTKYRRMIGENQLFCLRIYWT